MYSKTSDVLFSLLAFDQYILHVDSLQVPIDWEPVDVTPVKGPDGKNRIPQKAIDSVNKHKIGLKGPLATPIGKGHQSLNLALRK